MRSWWCFVVLVVCLSDQTFSQSFEFEEIVPVKISGRSSRRVSKRSEEQPSFRLTAFGRDFTLHLYPDNSFLAPTLQIKRIKTKEFSKTDRTADSQDSLHLPVIDSERINQTDEADGDIRRCFYTGTVDFSEDSVVAVSLCHGILGTFITGGDEYFIEPKLFGTGTNKGLAEQLHVVKRRNSTERQNDSKRLLTEMSGGDYKGYGLFIQNTHLLQDKAAGQKPLRHRRFVSTPRFIETLVVADSSLVQFYGDDVKHHVLTLMSVVAQIYKHPSVKNSVNVVVVKMLLVEDEDMGPSISSNGGVALRNFCSWQQLFNPTSQRHPEHYDTAVLFTREDICGHQSCDTLGVADVGTMCDSKKSCSVIEDNGLQAAFTAAHELGHVLSMPHDDSKICERLFGPIGKHHVMAPVFVHLNKTSPWSACSAFYVTEFFDKGHGDCLLDRPEEFLPLPKELPGMTYSLDQQCQQIFGEEFAHCPNISDSDVCSQLWCKKDGQSLCTTRNGSLPWADGTACAPNRACLNSACMPAEEVFRPREPVNGDWGEWGPWQECSRTCGGGIMFSYRECTNPVPQNGGKYCEGQRVRYQSCNTPACADKHGKSFREEQCEKYNSYNYLDIHGNVKRWIPKYAGVPPRDRCKLFCRARGSSEFKVFESKVIDGTTCGPDTTSICVQGQCIKAGCDKEIGSNKKLDKCGVCGGNGLSCRKISGSFNKAFYGYNDIVTIPSGATNIDIKQRSHRGIKHDGYYLAVKKEDGVYILNGNFSVSTVEQDIPVLGAVIKYSGSSTTLERIQSFHQLREAITIQLLSTAGDFTPPKVKYTFFIPKDVSFSKRTDQRTSVHMIHPFGVPQWVLGEWSECSRSCGSGWSRRNVECKDNAGFYSNHCDKDLKPIDIRPCGDIPCPIWQMGPWSSCSQTCGQGQRRRSVFCIDHTGKIVESEKCDPAKQPKPVSGECIYQDC